MTKGYAVFYESNSTTTNATAAITSIADSLPPSTRVGQVLDSFELVIASPEVAQPAEFSEDTADDEVEDDEEDTADEEEADDDGGDDDGGDDDGGDDDGGDDENCQNIGGTSCADDYDETAD